MGTNYALSVIFNGREMIRQYGQSDGHPSTVIPYLRNFFSTEGNIEHLKRNIIKCRFDSPNSPVMDNDLWLRIHNNVDYWKNLINNDLEIAWLQQHHGFSRQEIFEYLRRLRSTGASILDVMVMPWADESDVIYMWKARTTSTDSDGFFAAYKIDLDEEKVYCDWLGHKMEFDLNDFPYGDMIGRFESYELGDNFKLNNWSKFVYVIRNKNNGAYYNLAFTNKSRALRERDFLNRTSETWKVYEVRLPWVGRSLCYVSETYNNIYYSNIYSCLAHAKSGSMWSGHMESVKNYPSQCTVSYTVSDAEITNNRYSCKCNINRIRVIKES